MFLMKCMYIRRFGALNDSDSSGEPEPEIEDPKSKGQPVGDDSEDEEPAKPQQNKKSKKVVE